MYFPVCNPRRAKVGARKKNPSEAQDGRGPQPSSTNRSALAGSLFKTGVLAYYNGYCSWLFQATLGRLSFGTHTLRRLKDAMQISVIRHPLEVPLSGLTGVRMTRVAGSFHFQTARAPWPGATA